MEDLKNDILGKDYSLSVACLSEKEIRKINKTYRKKDKATNVLSFPYEKNFGEILLCPAIIKKEARKLSKTYGEWFKFLVIHGMLHLKGFVHSSRMERAEAKYDQKYFYRHRLRIVKDESRRGRIFKGRKKS